MSTKVVPGQLLALTDPAQIAREAAARIGRTLMDAIDARSRAILALSGGNTPRETYGRLAEERGIDWAKVHVFWVDERAVPPTDDRSNYHWAKATLLDAAPIPANQIHRMPADRTDLDDAARDYERVLREHVPAGATGRPAIDAIVLGIGDDGHTASLFPGDPTVDVVDRLVSSVPARPKREARMTLTAPVLQEGRSVFVLASGQSKNAALERAWGVHGNTAETPARVVRDCRGSLYWIVDRVAAGLA